MGAVDVRVEDAKAARARCVDRLEADGPVRIAELPGGGGERLAPANAAPTGGGDADLVEERVELGLVVGAPDGLGRAHEHRQSVFGEPFTGAGQPGQIVGRLRQDRVDPFSLAESQDFVRKGLVRPWRHPRERVAEESADGPLAHVAADQPDRPLAVLTECPEECCGARCAARCDEDGQRSHCTRRLVGNGGPRGCGGGRSGI